MPSSKITFEKNYSEEAKEEASIVSLAPEPDIWELGYVWHINVPMISI